MKYKNWISAISTISPIRVPTVSAQRAFFSVNNNIYITSTAPGSNLYNNNAYKLVPLFGLAAVIIYTVIVQRGNHDNISNTVGYKSEGTRVYRELVMTHRFIRTYVSPIDFVIVFMHRCHYSLKTIRFKIFAHNIDTTTT